MADDKKKDENFPLEKTPPKGHNERDRTDELPADTVQGVDQDRLKAANNFAGQTIEDHNENEVQGKLAVPHAKVMKRGQTKWTDKDGVVHKELNDAEPNVKLADEQEPDYLKLHEKVLNGEDPIKATLDFQGRKPQEGFAEGKLKDAELHPRTMGVGAATAAENEQKERK